MTEAATQNSGSTGAGRAGITRRETIRILWRLFAHVRPHLRLFIITILWSLLLSLSTNGLLWLIKYVFDNILKARDLTDMPWVLKTVGGLLVLLALSEYFGYYFRERVRWQITLDLRQNLIDHLLKLHIGFFEDRRSGDLMSRVTNDVNGTQNTLRFLYGEIVKSPIVAVGSLGLMFYLSWQMTVVVMFLLLVVVIPLRKYGRRIRKSSRKSFESLSSLTDIMQQVFSGIRAVKSFGQEDQESKRFADKNGEFFQQRMKVASTRAMSLMLSEVIKGLSLCVLLCLGSYLVIKNAFGLSEGTLLTFVALAGNVYNSVKEIVNAYNDIQESVPAAHRIFQLMDIPNALSDTKTAVALDEFKNEIVYENVSFGYDEAQVLTDINLKISKGEIVALVGRSGAGKSTMLDLLLRFYSPRRGRIAIDGRDICEFTHRSLLGQIAVVAQDKFLFNDTIRNNIRYFQPDASEEQVVLAARAAHLEEFINSLDKGLDTVVGERGAKLSGGQIQRITIARAILKKAPILLLDEATSALDSESEHLVQAALSELMKDRTTLVIAHRLSTVREADRIVVLEDGCIVETGKHQELLALNGVYRKLYDLQFLEAPKDKPADPVL